MTHNIIIPRAIIRYIIHAHKYVDDRIKHLEHLGYDVKKCYVPNYNGVGNMTYMSMKKEYRIIIGRPKNHFPKQVYAVILRQGT